jgi:hypothetical protein
MQACLELNQHHSPADDDSELLPTTIMPSCKYNRPFIIQPETKQTTVHSVQKCFRDKASLNSSQAIEKRRIAQRKLSDDADDTINAAAISYIVSHPMPFVRAVILSSYIAGIVTSPPSILRRQFPSLPAFVSKTPLIH